MRIFTENERYILKRKRFKNLDLMVRAFRVLEFNKIATLGKLLQYSKEDLLNLKGYMRSQMNTTCINDIEDELKKIDLHLRN